MRPEEEQFIACDGDSVEELCAAASEFANQAAASADSILCGSEGASSSADGRSQEEKTS